MAAYLALHGCLWCHHVFLAAISESNRQPWPPLGLVDPSRQGEMVEFVVTFPVPWQESPGRTGRQLDLPPTSSPVARPDSAILPSRPGCVGVFVFVCWGV